MSNYYDGSIHDLESKLYQWNGASFVEFQSIATTGAVDWAFFTIGSDSYLALANHRAGATAYNIDSKIYSANNLLSLHALAFDNDPTSPANLSPLFHETMEGIVAASEGHPEKRAVVLVDQDGEHDTRIYVVQDGIVTQIDGLPDSDGVLDGALDEYQMTDGATLGGFIKWARQEYGGVGMKTTFSYVAHGTFLTPAVDLTTIITDTRSVGAEEGLFPLTEINVKSSFTDKSPEYALITPHALQVALEVGTDGGNNPLEVLDVLHCFSGSLEELYDVSNANGTPYASTMVASPNYSYFAPDMLGRALAAVEPSATAAEMASSIMSAYEAAVDEADLADGDADVEHPRTTVVIDSSQLPILKTRIDEMAWYLGQAFDSNPLETKDKLFAAYNQTGSYYDSDYCPPQAWELGTPDGLVDSAAFLRAIAGQEISSAVTLRARRWQYSHSLLARPLLHRHDKHW